MAKDNSLEALRGIAALVVLAWHSTLAFAPAASGIFANGPSHSLQTSPLFVLINGTSAVFVFFVLSSFALVKRYAVSRDPRHLVSGAVRRWPRLAGPVLFTTLASCLAFKLGLYGFEKAGALTGSPWLERFGYASAIPTRETADFYDAAAQGAWRTFLFAEQTSYDSSLWTMHFEFWGSFLVFGMATFFFRLLDRSVLFAGLAAAGVAACAWLYAPVFIAFAGGVAIYALLAVRYRPGIAVRIGLAAAAILLLGYGGNAVGFYRPFAFMELVSAKPLVRLACVATIASMMLIYVLLTGGHRPGRFVGNASRWLGDLSFPLYLVHVPVICSAGAWTLVATGSIGLAALAGIVGSVLVALPLVAFNNWWVDALKRVSSLAFGRTAAVHTVRPAQQDIG